MPLGMNPDVDTSFLPDREREEADAKLRCQLLVVFKMYYINFFEHSL